MVGGELIREARRRAGLTQQGLADRLGTTQSVIARWESGRRSPAFATVVRAVAECGFALEPKLTVRDEGPLGVALTLGGLTPIERLAANRKVLALYGIASKAPA